MDVALDEIDSQLDGGSKRCQRVFGVLGRVPTVTAEQDATAAQFGRKRLRSCDRHRPMLREPSRDFYISRCAQEIQRTAVTPAPVSARAGRLSHDLTQDSVAGTSTAGAGAGDRVARAVPGHRAAPSVHAGCREGARRGRGGASGDLFHYAHGRTTGAEMWQSI